MSLQYLREWNEACVYAKECLPPFVYDLFVEPYDAIIVFSGICAIIWFINEKSLKPKNKTV